MLSTRFDGVELRELAGKVGASYVALELRRRRAERRLIVWLGYRPE